MRKTHIDLLRGYRVTLVHAAEEVSTVLWYGREYAVVNKYLKPITQDVEITHTPILTVITDNQNDHILMLPKNLGSDAEGGATLFICLPAIKRNSYSGELVNSQNEMHIAMKPEGGWE